MDHVGALATESLGSPDASLRWMIRRRSMTPLPMSGRDQRGKSVCGDDAAPDRGPVCVRVPITSMSAVNFRCSGKSLATTRRARRRGIMMMPGAGLASWPSDCLAMHVAALVPKAKYLRIAQLRPNSFSRGTFRSALGFGRFAPSISAAMGNSFPCRLANCSAGSTMATASGGKRCGELGRCLDRPLFDRKSAISKPISRLISRHARSIISARASPMRCGFHPCSAGSAVPLELG